MRAALDMLLGVAILALFSAAGGGVATVAHSDVPGPVFGLLLLLAWLTVMGRVPRPVGAAAELLIRHLNLFYIPAAVALTAYSGLLLRDAWPIAVAIVAGTWSALASTALTFRAVSRASERRGQTR